MTYATILFEPDPAEGFVTITLNRPERLNAIDRTLATEFDDALRRACTTPEIGAILITGAGRAFCAGYDLVAEDYAKDAEWWRDNVDACCRHLLALWETPLPTVAAIHGHALAGGLELMMCCDLAIAAEDARLGEPEVRHASGPPTLMLPWTVPIRHARHLMYTGDMIDGQEAARIHLVNRAVPKERLMPEARRLATKLARMPKPAIKYAKASLNQAQLLAGLLASWQYNRETVAQLHASAPGRAWLQRLLEMPLREFLERREAPFRQLDD